MARPLGASLNVDTWRARVHVQRTYLDRNLDRNLKGRRAAAGSIVATRALEVVSCRNADTGILA